MELKFTRRLRTAGRFTIPHEIIDVLRIKHGDKIYFTIDDIPVPFAGVYSADTRFTIPVNIRHLFNLRMNDFIAVSISGIDPVDLHGWVL